jgi:cellulose synthase operon protein C
MNLRKSKLLAISLLILAVSCTAKDSRFKEAEKLSRQSREDYRNAIAEYRAVLTAAADKSMVLQKLGALYFEHKDYDLAAQTLQDLTDLASQKMLAVARYKMGNYTDALEVFNRVGTQADGQFMYSYGLTCEKLNLYDQAKKIYGQISAADFAGLARQRMQAIDAQSPAAAQDPAIIKLLQDSPGEAEYPQAGAIILSADEKIEITPENTEISESHYIIKILNERGRNYAEVDIDYDSTYEKAEFLSARTIKPSGEVVNVGTKHIRDVSRYMDFPLYSNARALIVSMPEVIDGSIIEYRVRVVRNKLIADKEFNLAYTLQEDEPLLSAKLVLTVPQGREVNSLVLNQKFNSFAANLEPRISAEGKSKIFRWEFKDIPQIIPEPMMPPTSEITPAFILSSFKSWENIYRWWWDLAKDKIDINPEMKAKVKELVSGKDTAEAKTRAVYNWCIRNIRYVGIEYGQAGYEPHRATEIFANKYGDCKDQAILLISLLKESGIEAYPVLIGTKGTFKLEEKLPAMMFNHCIAATKLGQELVFMDPTGETVPFGDLPSADQDRKVLVFFKDHAEIVSTPDFPAEHNRLVKKTTIRINPDETIEAEREVATFGYYDQRQHYKFKYTRPILIEESLKEAVHQIVPGGKLLEYKIANIEDMDRPVKLFYKLSGPNYLIRAGRARVVSGGSIDTSLVARDRRDYDIDFGALDVEESFTTIELPKNLTLKFLPESLTNKTKWSEIINDYSFKDNKIILSSKNIMLKKTVAKEDYREFKAALEDLAEKTKQCIILEKTEQATPPKKK